MIVLGLSEGPNGVAVLLADDEIVAVEQQSDLDRTVGSTRFPWAAMETALQNANIRNAEVDRVAVAGRHAPPFFVRRFPGVRKWIRPKPASPIFDAASAYQHMLGWSGFGSYQEDQTAAWLERKFVDRGLAKRAVRMVHTHQALAAGAYACQPESKRDIVVAHARGDGPPLMRFEARDILVQERTIPESPGTLHTWLERAMSRCGFDPWNEGPTFWYEAMCGDNDPQLFDVLLAHLNGSMTGRIAARSLNDSPIQTACATVVAALADRLVNLMRPFCHGDTPVILTGGLVSHPLIRGRMLEYGLNISFPEHSHKVGLALGAAANVVGMGPRRPSRSRRQCVSNLVRLERALQKHGLQPKKVKDAFVSGGKALGKGKAIAVFNGSTSRVLIRADQTEVIDRVKTRLGQAESNDWSLVVVPGEEEAAHTALVAQRTRSAEINAFTASLVSGWVPVRRVDPAQDPVLFPLLREARRVSGCAGFLSLPLAVGNRSPVGLAHDSLHVSRLGGLDGILLGPYWVGLES